jgi:hypothetical protein
MAEVPPTPLFPTRMGGWNIEDASLLMDQQPIFGDESMLDMTFEMSRIEDGPESGNTEGVCADGECSTATVVMSAKDEEGWAQDEDGEVEVAREAGEHLDRLEPIFLADQDDHEMYIDTNDQNDYYGDYPPSPFLDNSMWKSKRTIQPESHISSTSIVSPPVPYIDISFNQVDLDLSNYVSAMGEDVLLGETTFTARGEKSTWAEEELEMSLAIGRDSIASGSGNGVRSRSSKRSSSFPSPAREIKRGTFFTTRVLSISSWLSQTKIASSGSTISSELLKLYRFPLSYHTHHGHLSTGSLQSSSSSALNAAAGPSRIPQRKRTASPPIHGSVC